MPLEGATVAALEEQLAEVLRQALERPRRPRLPYRPTTRTLHLMAKAAVAVYEAAAERAPEQ